jgi:hypothetical protein
MEDNLLSPGFSILPLLFSKGQISFSSHHLKTIKKELLSKTRLYMFLPKFILVERRLRVGDKLKSCSASKIKDTSLALMQRLCI